MILICVLGPDPTSFLPRTMKSYGTVGEGEVLWDHSFSKYSKFIEKLIFLTP